MRRIRFMVRHLAFGDNAVVAIGVIDAVTGMSDEDVLEIIYRETNSVDEPWFAEGVRESQRGAVGLTLAPNLNGKGGVRSTSVGDVVHLMEDGPTFRMVDYEVSPVGFREISHDQFVILADRARERAKEIAESRR